MTYTCSRCKQQLPRSEFYNSSKTPSGVGYTCKACLRLARQSRPTVECSVEGCSRPMLWKARGYCLTHTTQYRATGSVTDIRLRRRPEDYLRDNEALCNTCQRWYPTDCFRIRDKGNVEATCRDCRNLRKRGLNYGMSYEEIKEAAQSSCLACGSKEALCIDHDHKCCPGEGKTCGECRRGVLCRDCNWVLGKIQDSPERLRALIEYLDTWSST